MDCMLCRFAAGEDEPSDGWLIRNDLVTAYVSGGNSDIGGWCQVQVNRHAPTLADLTAEEVAAVGVAAQRLAAAILASTQIEGQRIYMYAMCEFVPHFHLVLGPAPVTSEGEDRGSALLIRLLEGDDSFRDAAAAAGVFARMRSFLADDSQTAGR